MSCDLLPTEAPGPHYEGDVLDILGDGWDLMVAHPPCTYLTSSGLHWNKRVPGRAELTEQALAFVLTLLNAPIPKIALENPVGCISSRIRKPDQIIQPYEFGADASKKTCLWLKGLPPAARRSGRPLPWPQGRSQRARGRALVEPDRQRPEQPGAVRRQVGAALDHLSGRRGGHGRAMGLT